MIGWFGSVFLSSVILFLAAVPWLWLWQSRGSNRFSPLLYRAGVWVFCFYLMGLAAATGVASLLFQAPEFAPRWNGILFVDLFLCPEQYVLNIMLFLPLGFLAPLLWSSWRQENRVVLLGFVASAAIEMLQMFCGRVLLFLLSVFLLRLCPIIHRGAIFFKKGIDIFFLLLDNGKQIQTKKGTSIRNGRRRQ